MNKFYESRLNLLGDSAFISDYSKIDTTTVYDREFIHKPGQNICLIGESPGKNEVEKGIPFCGQAGKNLSKLIALSMIPRGDFCITNGFCFRTFTTGSKGIINRPPTPEELKAGAILLSKELEILQPKMIILLGNSAIKAFKYINDDALRLAFKSIHRNDIIRVHSDLLQKEILLAHTFHPSPLVYNQPSKRAVLEEFFSGLLKCL